VGLRTWDGSDAWFDNLRVEPVEASTLPGTEVQPSQ